MQSGQSHYPTCEQPLAIVDSLVGQPVTIITSIGVEIDGTLKGFDRTVNCVLEDATEYNFSVEGSEPRHCRMTLINGSTISAITAKLPR